MPSSSSLPTPPTVPGMLEPRTACIFPRRSGNQKVSLLKKSVVCLSLLDIVALFPLRQAEAAAKLVRPSSAPAG
eukprot:758772-Hanusia_phi.AAC.2